MRIKTEPCNAHSRLFDLSDHSAHSYRFLKRGPARRCPKRTIMSDYFRYEWEHPSVEVQTLRELRRIRQMLETKS